MVTRTPLPDVGLLYERYGSSIRRFAGRVTGDPDDADDALHDAFLAAWRARDRFDPSRDPLPWLLTIARRKAVTIVARRSRPVPPAPPERSAPSAEMEALRREGEARAFALLREEPALRLAVLGDLPARAVGELLGVPLRTAASRIARGRRRIENFLTATRVQSPRSKAS
jgi:RNA polymerase sigma-70 factor (ECF subfamily)